MSSRQIPKITIARRLTFSSAHLYNQPAWSAEKNAVVFGKCFSQYGHGHDYVLECRVEGPIDPLTGMILNLVEIDALMNSVTVMLDHKHLNFDVEYFKTHIPTTENIALFCFQELLKKFAQVTNKNARLVSVRVYETPDLFAEVAAS